MFEFGQEPKLNIKKKKSIKFYGTFSIYADDSEITRKHWESKIAKEREKHNEQKPCQTLSYFIDDGEEENMTPIIHIPNIRTFAILNKKEYGGFEPMDYCPFCGAKFPERLDVKLTEILQKEYGVNSWSDYKKAPREFHTDEWWEKLGL